MFLHGFGEFFSEGSLFCGKEGEKKRGLRLGVNEVQTFPFSYD